MFPDTHRHFPVASRIKQKFAIVWNRLGPKRATCNKRIIGFAAYVHSRSPCLKNKGFAWYVREQERCHKNMNFVDKFILKIIKDPCKTHARKSDDERMEKGAEGVALREPKSRDPCDLWIDFSCLRQHGRSRPRKSGCMNWRCKRHSTGKFGAWVSDKLNNSVPKWSPRGPKWYPGGRTWALLRTS